MEQGTYVSMGAFLAPLMSLVVREGAVAWWRSATGAVTMMTRHSIALRSHTSDFDAEYIQWGSVLAVVVPLVVREGAVCLVTLRDGRCDNDDATFDSFSLFYTLGDV